MDMTCKNTTYSERVHGRVEMLVLPLCVFRIQCYHELLGSFPESGGEKGSFSYISYQTDPGLGVVSGAYLEFPSSLLGCDTNFIMPARCDLQKLGV